MGQWPLDLILPPSVYCLNFPWALRQVYYAIYARSCRRICLLVISMRSETVLYGLIDAMK